MNFSSLAIIATAFVLGSCVSQTWPSQYDRDSRFEQLDDWGGAVLRDKETGLVWQRIPAEAQFTWADAVDACYKLVAGPGEDGRRARSGFRMPRIEEFMSLTYGEGRLIRDNFPGEFRLGTERRRVRADSCSRPECRYECSIAERNTRFWAITDDPEDGRKAYQFTMDRVGSSFPPRYCSVFSVRDDAPPETRYNNIRFSPVTSEKSNRARTWCVRGPGENPRPAPAANVVE